MSGFAAKLVAWQKRHGRQGLPWQNTRDPYAIWVSEIMLQQTRVAAVIPYYLRFMRRFPTLAALGAAPLDDVLQHWSGLGYYSRARNLHRAAQILHGGEGDFPQAFESIAELPGIGRSTAAAICVFAFGERRAILDGNVKRVLTRYHGIRGYPGDRAVEDQLWRIAQRLVPRKDVEAYTQGLMDLGASLCVRRQPKCLACPMRGRCFAYARNMTDRLPAAKPKRMLPQKRTVMLILEHAGEVLLQRRPATGIWGGLWSFPELTSGVNIARTCGRHFGVRVTAVQRLPAIEHAFSHFRLRILPRRLQVTARGGGGGEPGQIWLAPEDAMGAAVPAPVKRILASL